MNRIIDWLVVNEEKAAALYERAASILAKDGELSAFLKALGSDELEHLNSIRKASGLAGGVEDIAAVIRLEDSTVREVSKLFENCEKRIEAKKLSEEDILGFVVDTEYCEWNDLFLFAINALRRCHREFIPVAVKIHQHKKSIERFLKSRKNGARFLKKIKDLEPLWRESFLVIDDEEIVADAIEAVLEDEGEVVRAANGEEGLKRLGERYFSAIITDVDMPVMGGIEFYKKASGKYPNLKERLLFFTGIADEERLAFFRENNLRFMKKPSGIRELKDAVIEIVYR